MAGISLVTKGMLCAPAGVELVVQSGSGGAGLVRKDEELPKPFIKVNHVKIGEGKKVLSKENVKVTSVKLIID